MTLICFFYGNGVPVEMAVQLFQACNDMADLDLAEYFFEFYYKWQNDTDTTHLDIYFNMQEKEFLFINGSRKNKLGIVNFLANDIHMGFRHNYSIALKNKIQRIRSDVPYYT
jgi:hypothetical protein